VHDDELREQRPLKPLPPRRLAATVIGALVLILLVVVASRSSRPSGKLDTGGQTTSTVVLNAGLLIVAIIFAGLVAASVFSFRPGRSGRPQPRTGPKLLGQLLGVLLIAAFAFAIVSIVRGRHNQGAQSSVQRVSDYLKTLAAHAHSPGKGIDWIPIAIVFTATLATLFVAVAWMLRRELQEHPEQPLEERLAAIFDETLADLRAERDPRRAVIAAYVRMERLLGRSGMQRHPAEAPHEYVGRVLEDMVSSGSSVERLTALYERAKFSEHEIDPAMQAAAITALETIRDELRANEAEKFVVAPR
jgi:hypothetical protein